MTWEAWFTAGTVIIVLVAMIRDLVPPWAAMAGGMTAVLVTGIVTPAEALAGFSNPAPITVAALFVLARGVEQTGLLAPVVGSVLGESTSTRRALARMVVPVAGVSAFLNNTPIVAMLAPQVERWADRRGLSPSRFLMPLSFAALLGGVVTVIGTSTNVVVAGLMVEAGMAPLGFFEIGRLGLPMAAVGCLLLVALAPVLLPERRSARRHVEETARDFVVDMTVDPGGPLDGKRVADGGLRHLAGVFLAAVDRDGSLLGPASPDLVLRGGDRLRFVGRADTVVDLQTIAGLTPPAIDPSLDLSGTRYFEAVIGWDSPLVGRTLKESRFRGVYRAAVLAVHRAGQRIDSKLGDVPLRVGDTLVLVAEPDFRDRWRDRADFLLVAELGDGAPRPGARRGLVAVVLLLVVGVAGLGILPILEASLLGAAALVAGRVLTPSEALAAVDLDVILVIATAFGVGAAVESSGLASLAAGALTTLFAPWGATGLLLAVVLPTMVLTAAVTNNAAALFMFPVAVTTAEAAGLDPRGFVIAVAVAASVDFLTPIGYQTNTMVYGPGGYRFGDYPRLGAPLTLAGLVTTLAVVPRAWPM